MGAIIKEAIKIETGQYIHVDKFPPMFGFRCGCICPECGEEVGSRIQKKETGRESSFFIRMKNQRVLVEDLRPSFT